jgi:hypothetical protein
VTSEAERDVMVQRLMANVEVVASVLRGSDSAEADSAIAAVAATRSLGLIVEDTLRTVVAQARAEGYTWAEIGRILHVSRQAAFKRFGTMPTPEDLFDDLNAAPIEDAQERALAMLDDFLQRRLAQLHGTFGARMRERLSLEVVESHRAKIESRFGAPTEIGEPTVGVRHGHTFVDVPVAFERGDLRARVAFDRDGEVVGMRLQNVAGE